MRERQVTTGLLLGMAACTTPPEGIPDEPLPFDLDDAVLGAWLAASPDNLDLLASLDRATPTGADACPRVEETPDGLLVTGGGCSDGAGTWSGTLAIEEDRLDFEGFGVDDGRARWTMDGWIVREPVPDGPDERIDLRGTLTWAPSGPEVEGVAGPFTAWLDLAFTSGWDGGRKVIADLSGEVGLVDLGTAGVAAERVQGGLSAGCDWPDDGELRLEGDRELVFRFQPPGAPAGGTGFVEGCDVPCPAVLLDGVEDGTACDRGEPPRLAITSAIALRGAP